jgi:hypothetical protein
MNSMLGSPEFARYVAQRIIQDRVADAQARGLGRRTRKGPAQPGSDPRTRHSAPWLLGSVRPAH